MSNSTAQVLMKKGKRGAAAYIHADCSSGSPQHLGPLLDVLLNPSKSIDEWETKDWCRWLLAGGRTPDEFAAIVRSFDKHDKCGLVWIPRVVAYRCRTCGISPCMSICRDCFHRGDHSTHDFNMFLSQAGGACDCGDKSVMKEDGFCSNHGNKCPAPGTVPAELLCVAEAMMPRLVLRLLQHFRENSFNAEASSHTYRVAVQECEGYVQMLMDINNMGDLMRVAMTKALINPQMYRGMVVPPFADTEYGAYMAESHRMYEMALDSFPPPDLPEHYLRYRDLPPLTEPLQHNTLLDELLFWTFKYEFPQNVVCFLLNMLPDQDYKEQLTRTFVVHYSRIPLVLEHVSDPDTLSNRVVHMSVQLFSNEALALRCVHQLHLLHVMILAMRTMMGRVLVPCPLHRPDDTYHRVIDCSQRVMREHCYWPLVSDFHNVLTHKRVAMLFLQDDTLIDMWFEFLSLMQGMNVNVRETGGHIEFEPSSYYAAFSCELEAAAYPMWSVVSHLAEERRAELAVRLVRAARAHLRDWLDAVQVTRPAVDRAGAARASFHFPLHRHLAAFLCAGVRSLGLRAADLLPPPDTLALLALHPLRVQSLYYEILAGIWVRNGLQIKGQAMTYIQANFCNSMVDMDIYWLQVCAAHLPPDRFMDLCIDTFGVREWLSLAPMTASQAAEQDAMVEGLLMFLAILVSSKTNISNDELTQSRLEVATLLAAGDKTHSQLIDLIPERSGNSHTKNFETVLKELASYRPPPRDSENLEQGLFVPRPVVWEQHYDPLHVLRRAVYRRDFHASMERFTAYVRDKEKAEGGPPASRGPLWPPLRPTSRAPPAGGDPRNLCASGVLHGALLAVLYRAVHRRGAGGAGGVAGGSGGGAPADHVLALAVHLLRVAAAAERDAPQEEGARRQCVPRAAAGPAPGAAGAARPAGGGAGGGGGAGPPRPLLGALRGSLRQHVCAVVRAVRVPEPPAPPPAPYPGHLALHSDSDTEWEPDTAPMAAGVLGVLGALAGPGGALPAASTAGAGSTSRALAVPQPMEMEVHGRAASDELSDAAGDARRVRALQSGSDDSQALALPDRHLDLDGDPDLDRDQDFTLALPERSELVHSPMHFEEEEDSDGAWGGLGRERERERPPALPAPPAALAPCSSDTTMEVVQSGGGGGGGGVGGGGGGQHAHAHAHGEEYVTVNESIISLLLKLHSQLSGRLDSFSLDDPAPPPDHCIGDGAHFVGLALRELAALDPRCALALQHTRRALWPDLRERQAEQSARERLEKEKRSQRANDRKKQLMREIARQQREFLRTMETELGDAAAEWDEAPERYYDCVICNTTTPTTATNPIGLVVLLQSTAVVGHRRRAGSGELRLALSEAERVRLAAQHDATAAAHHYRLHDDLQTHFDQESWLQSVSVGWEGGVHLQSCGHHLHLRCLHAYLRTLAAPQRPHNLLVDRGEFHCPLCRQLANSVLPLAPAPRSVPRPPSAGAEPSPPPLAEQVAQLLEARRGPAGGGGGAPGAETPLAEAMARAMENMMSTAVNRLRLRYGSSPAALFTFVASLVRTNLECELVQRGGSLLADQHLRYKPKPDRYTIQPLMVVVGEHARLFDPQRELDAAAVWRQLALDAPGAAGAVPGAGGGGGAPVAVPEGGARPVPLLLRDPLALLMQLLVLAPPDPPHLDIQHFTCIVRALYALTYYQIVAQFLAASGPGARASLAAAPCAGGTASTGSTGSTAGTGSTGSTAGDGLREAARTLLTALAGSDLFTEDGSPMDGPDEEVDLDRMEDELQALLLPFLRIAALLRHHLYAAPLPDVAAPAQEFPLLLQFLELADAPPTADAAQGVTGAATDAATGAVRGARRLARRWARQLGGGAARAQVALRRLLAAQHVRWEQPALLRLPRDYDRLFTYYHERVCLQCGAVPKDASVCLLCGTLVCLKQPCCRQHQIAEAVQHAAECGGGTGIFLVVTSTYMIVIRGRRACLWGSLYLDDYDEEDKDLKRGKPLYLSEDRRALLQAQWLAHRFDHTKRTWVWHRDSL